MPIKIIRRSLYRKLLAAADERDRLREEEMRRDEAVAQLSRERDDLTSQLKQTKAEFDTYQTDSDEAVERRVAERLREMNISRRRFEQLAADRAEIVELCTERLYNMACRFSMQSAEAQENRGLFILLVDRRNMDPHNFSDFHEGQAEYLDHDEFRGLERMPQIFSPVAQQVLEYMGGKEMRLSREGEILGYEERDGAIIVDLRGVIHKTRQMVEGVRTHKVYSKVERLLTGSARHNAALYASSLDEVLIAIVVSEETNQVTLFRDGRFDRCYDPYEQRVITRDEYDQFFGGNDEPNEAAHVVAADDKSHGSDSSDS